MHLVPEDVWREHEQRAEYRPAGLDTEGFIHCTDDEALVIEVGNRYYRDDSRPYLIIDVDLSRLGAPATYEDDARLYPHIYGPIERHAISRVRRVERAPDGTFVGIGPQLDDLAA